jgi:hypothetical protein
MLIPNKFNGYQADGCRLLPVGGGVGEAALIGAAMGGGSAALTGGDPLKGALLGGLTGGVGAGLTPAATAVTAAEASLLPAGQSFAQASQAANAAQTAAQTAAMAQAPTAALNASINSALPLTSGVGAVPVATGASPFIATAPGAAAPQGIASLMKAAPAATAAPAASTAAAGAAPMTSFQQAMNSPFQYIKDNPFKMGAAALAGATGAREELEAPGEYDGPLKRFRYNPDVYRPQFAEGGVASLTSMPVERMSDRNDAMAMMANRGQMYAAGGGISSLGSYSDGGRMLKGPGDGMSDSIPASISNKRPARLADGEFVVPADVVSHLGNGSTDAGARQLYSMMDKVRSARTGTKKQGRQIRPQKMMPA